MDLHGVVADLSRIRPVFHSEADFQHALAWLIHEESPSGRVRLEVPLLADRRQRFDLWVQEGQRSAVLELKYLTRALSAVVDGEPYSLRDQAAHDIARYDVVKDIVRVESVVRAGRASDGHVLVLTNDQNHWRGPSGTDTVDHAFRLHDGTVLAGTLKWSDEAGAGTTRGREKPLVLSGTYTCRWRDYSTVSEAPGGRFRYLCFTIGPAEGNNPTS